MSSREIAVTTSQNRLAGNGHGSSSNDDDRPEDVRFVVPWPLYYGSENGGSMYAPWRSFEERVRTGPFGLTSFPSQPYSPMRILILEPHTQPRVNPRLRQFIRDSSPRIREDWHLRSSQQPEEPGLTDAEFKSVMKKLKPQVYNPAYPRKKAWKRGLFGKSSISHNISISGGADDDGEDKKEGKDCTICLEAFVPNERVQVTPCNHMFHNDCIVPWLKGHGQCPVCRFVLYKRKERALSWQPNSYNSRNTASQDELASDLISLVRAMEEAFNWVNLSD